MTSPLDRSNDEEAILQEDHTDNDEDTTHSVLTAVHKVSLVDLPHETANMAPFIAAEDRDCGTLKPTATKVMASRSHKLAQG